MGGGGGREGRGRRGRGSRFYGRVDDPAIGHVEPRLVGGRGLLMMTRHVTRESDGFAVEG